MAADLDRLSVRAPRRHRLAPQSAGVADQRKRPPFGGRLVSSFDAFALLICVYCLYCAYIMFDNSLTCAYNGKYAHTERPVARISLYVPDELQARMEAAREAINF